MCVAIQKQGELSRHETVLCILSTRERHVHTRDSVTPIIVTVVDTHVTRHFQTNQISIQFNHKNTTHVWQTETGAQGHINSQARGRTLSSASTRDYARQ